MKKLNSIKGNLNLEEFHIHLPNEKFGFAHLHFIRVNAFDNLFLKIHKELNQTSKTLKQKKILDYEKLVYEELATHLTDLISGIENGTIKIVFTYNVEDIDLINTTLDVDYKLKNEDSFDNKLKTLTLIKLQKQLLETKQAIFELKNYQFSTYKNEEFLGGNFFLRFPKEIIIYNEVSIGNSRYGSSVLFKDDTQREDVVTMLNIIAFFQASPNFLQTKNKSYNEKLVNIYNEFDILDLLTLTSNKFFNNPKSKFRSLSTPIFKLRKDTNFTILPETNSNDLLHLYHSSLKQIEPLPRCVFLFRIVEYGKNYHYQRLFRQPKIDLKDVIEYYYNEAKSHRFIPLFFLDYGSDWDSKTGEMVDKRKTQYLNFMTELKNKSKQILNKWRGHSYLGSKSLGTIIYNTGRNTVAHGGNGTQNINYDYANKYKHINDVNVFLELIARYLIEIENPEFKKAVHWQKSIYEMNCSHMKMMKQENNIIEISNNG
ncbi:hypothetical protein ACXR6G_17165 [Ancylomarina sp. YFZ004]